MAHHIDLAVWVVLLNPLEELNGILEQGCRSLTGCDEHVGCKCRFAEWRVQRRVPRLKYAAFERNDNAVSSNVLENFGKEPVRAVIKSLVNRGTKQFQARRLEDVALIVSGISRRYEILA